MNWKLIVLAVLVAVAGILIWYIIQCRKRDGSGIDQPVSNITSDNPLEKVKALAEKYAPVLWLYEQDDGNDQPGLSWPSSVNFFFEKTYPAFTAWRDNEWGHTRTTLVTRHQLNTPDSQWDGRNGQPPKDISFGGAYQANETPPVYAMVYPGYWAGGKAPQNPPCVDASKDCDRNYVYDPSKLAEGTFVLCYYTFYPWNGGKKVKIVGTPLLGEIYMGNHVGDIEGFKILFQNWKPKAVFLGIHNYQDVKFPWGYTGEVPVYAKQGDEISKQKAVEHTKMSYENGRPILYSARGGHGCWAEEGNHSYAQGKFGQQVIKDTLVDQCRKGTKWETWNNVVLVEPDVWLGKKEARYLDTSGKEILWAKKTGMRNWMRDFQGWGNPKLGCFLLEGISGECRTNNGPAGFAWKFPFKDVHPSPASGKNYWSLPVPGCQSNAGCGKSKGLRCGCVDSKQCGWVGMKPDGSIVLVPADISSEKKHANSNLAETCHASGFLNADCRCKTETDPHKGPAKHVPELRGELAEIYQ